MRKYKTGYFFTDEFREQEGSSWNGYEHNVLLKNLGDGRFVDVGMALGADDIRDARGVAVSDFDRDGDLDIVVNHNPGVREQFREGIAPALLRNDVPVNAAGEKMPHRNWLSVELIGGAGRDPRLANRDAIGSEVVVTLEDGSTMLRHVVAGSSYASQCSRQLHFGLGAHEEVKRLVVRWKRPAKTETVLENVRANQFLRIDQYETNKPLAATDGEFGGK